MTRRANRPFPSIKGCTSETINIASNALAIPEGTDGKSLLPSIRVPRTFLGETNVVFPAKFSRSLKSPGTDSGRSFMRSRWRCCNWCNTPSPIVMDWFDHPGLMACLKTPRMSCESFGRCSIIFPSSTICRASETSNSVPSMKLLK